jgi:Rab GDP dissociation inhibitor
LRFGSECVLCCFPCSDKCFISKGYDATSHFETTVEDVLEMYKRITGKDLDLTAKDPAAVEA